MTDLPLQLFKHWVLVGAELFLDSVDGGLHVIGRTIEIFEDGVYFDEFLVDVISHLGKLMLQIVVTR